MDLSNVTFISTMKQFCVKYNSVMVIPSKTPKSRYFISLHLFTFHSLVPLLLPTVKLNGVSQPISIEYKVVQGLNQAVFRTLNFENSAVLDFSSLQQCPDVTMKKKLAESATQWKIIAFEP